LSLDILQGATNMQFTEPPNYCDMLLWSNGGLGGGGGDFLEEGNVGPYDYAIIRNESAGEMIAWLRENGYRITPEMEPLIAVYVEEGMYFLAMKLSQEAEVGDIQPVVMTYESTHPMIPIRLTAVAAVPNMPILTWIFADRQYVPENYAHVVPDYSRFRGATQIREIFGFGFVPNSEYTRELARIQTEYNGLAFVTELAGLSRDLPEATQDDPLLTGLIEDYPYITRLRAQMSPEQMTVDPTFIPAPNARDVSNQIDLSDHVDPLQYWGCSSRSVRVPTSESRLPTYTRLDDWRLHLGLPPGWVMSTFESSVEGEGYERTVAVFAPEPVGEDTVRAFFDGKDTPPMLVISRFNRFDSWSYTPQQSVLDMLGLPLDSEVSDTQYWGTRVRFQLYESVDSSYVPGIVFINLLTTQDDWGANEQVYQAALDYASSYQYYSHPKLRHTLFLNNPFGWNEDPHYLTAYVGYPESWLEHWSENNYAVVMPEDTTNGNGAPSARLLPLTEVLPSGERMFIRNEDFLRQVAEVYALSDQQLEGILDSVDACTLSIGPLAYERDGRRGYISMVGGALLEASAPVDDFAGYDETLRQIAESLAQPISGCG
jgi:hypothetical protein